jgi:uncharacterized protein affecting Mg2+/Co2+ transport
MPTGLSRSSSRVESIRLRAAVASALLSLAPTALAQDLPAFRKGLWEFTRTIEGGAGKTQKITTRQCTNPTDDMKKQNDMLTKAGCKFSPVAKSGNAYRFTSQCSIQGVSAQSKSVLTAEGDSAYRVNVESQHGGQSTKELLVARRIGDC